MVPEGLTATPPSTPSCLAVGQPALLGLDSGSVLQGPLVVSEGPKVVHVGVRNFHSPRNPGPRWPFAASVLGDPALMVTLPGSPTSCLLFSLLPQVTRLAVGTGPWEGVSTWLRGRFPAAQSGGKAWAQAPSWVSPQSCTWH